jgi:hypothetical protein
MEGGGRSLKLGSAGVMVLGSLRGRHMRVDIYVTNLSKVPWTAIGDSRGLVEGLGVISGQLRQGCSRERKEREGETDTVRILVPPQLNLIPNNYFLSCIIYVFPVPDTSVVVVEWALHRMELTDALDTAQHEDCCNNNCCRMSIY